MNSIYKSIIHSKSQGKKMFAALLDPEKCTGGLLDKTLNRLEKHHPDFIFVGGSTGMFSSGILLEKLEHIPVPKILFPGDASQFSTLADGLLFLSLLSGRNSDYLIGQHVKSALEVKKSGVEVIPTAYILIDGGKLSAVERVSQTSPLSSDSSNEIIATAVAGELLGMQMVYLEAGSGAGIPVSEAIIRQVKSELAIPLIVGGGITDTDKLKIALDAGADIVVIGNALEKDPGLIATTVRFIEAYNR